MAYKMSDAMKVAEDVETMKRIAPKVIKPPPKGKHKAKKKVRTRLV